MNFSKTNNKSFNFSFKSSLFSCILATKQGLIQETEWKITLALGIASISSLRRSLIACTWSSIAFNAASTANRSVMLLAGYTAKGENGRISQERNWICMRSNDAGESRAFLFTYCFGRWLVLEAPWYERWRKKL